MAASPPSPRPDGDTVTDTAAAPSRPSCGACGAPPAYCCPRCDARSCSVACVRAHKQATGCTGKRDRAAFVPLAAMTETTLVYDIHLLEEAASVSAAARAATAPITRGPPPGRAAACLPPHLRALVGAAEAEGVTLKTLPAGMDARRRNTSCVERKSDRAARVRWRVEWRLAAAPKGGAPAWTDARVDPDVALGALLAAHVAKSVGAAGGAASAALAPYLSTPPADLILLLKLEGRPANAPLYARLDGGASVTRSLAGRTMVEFPTVIVALASEASGFAVEEEEEKETAT